MTSKFLFDNSILTISMALMKKCFKCHEEKPRSEFYVHSRMSDGLLGKCKACTKKDVAENHKIKTLDPLWVQSERERCREKQARFRARGDAKPKTAEACREWIRRNPHKRAAQLKAQHALDSGRIIKPDLCEMCESVPPKHKHHYSYDRPLEVVWLCHACHGFLHRKTILDPVWSVRNA